MIDFIIQQTQNPLFMGIVSAALIGSITYVCRNIHNIIFKYFKLMCMHWTTIYGEDDAYNIILEFIDKHKLVKYSKHAIITANDTRNKWWTSNNIHKVTWFTGIGNGQHVLKYKGTHLFVNLVTETNTASYTRRITLTFNYFSKKKFQQFINDVFHEIDQSEHVRVYNYNKENWTSTNKLKRSIDTIYMNNEQKEKLLNDVTSFFNSKDWYVKRGVPYRRGYLFYGLPGTGKSSVALALASYAERPLYIINLTQMSDASLTTAFNNIPPGSIILMEDVDSCSTTLSRETISNAPNGAQLADPLQTLSLSCLLNVLDGVNAYENSIVILTTNYPEKLDSALVRAGRINCKIEFDKLNIEAACQMYRNFFGDEKIDKFKETYIPITPAELQDQLIKHTSINDKIEEIIPAVTKVPHIKIYSGG